MEFVFLLLTSNVDYCSLIISNLHLASSSCTCGLHIPPHSNRTFSLWLLFPSSYASCTNRRVLCQIWKLLMAPNHPLWFLTACLSPSACLCLRVCPRHACLPGIKTWIFQPVLQYTVCLTMHHITPAHIPSPTLCTETSWPLTWLQRQWTLMVCKASHLPTTSHTTLRNGAITSIYIIY